MKPQAPPPAAALHPQILPLAPNEMLRASLVFLGLALVYFHGPILGGGIAQQTSPHIEAPQGLTGTTEDVYQGYPPFYFAAREIRRGKLPLWTPHACGGTPFIGKQQSRTFSPFKPLFYLLPTSAFQYLWLVSFILHFYVAWISTFALARWYGADFKASLLSAAGYTFSTFMIASSIECTGEAAVYAPGLFFMAEQFLHGNRRLGLTLLPWLVAFPVLSGHMQIAFYCWVSVGIYVVALAWLENPGWGQRLKQIASFAGAAALGAALGAAPVIIGLEYIARSYTKVWRSSLDFSWFMARISRPLTSDDIPCATLGLLSIGALVWSLRALKLSAPNRPLRPWAWLAGAASLAAALASFFNIGLLSPWIYLSFTPGLSYEPAVLLFGALFYFLALLALLDSRLPRGLKVMGGLLLFGRIMYLRMPLLAHLLYKAPVYKSLSLDNYHATAELALSVLGGWGLWRLGALAGEAWEKRRQACLAAAQATLMIAGGFALSTRLKDPIASTFGTGINSQFLQSDHPLGGGIMDPGTVRTPEQSFVIRGWAGHPEAVQAVYAGFHGQELKPAELKRSADRVYFSLPAKLKPGANIPVAVAVNSRGDKISWRGSEISLMQGPSAGLWIGLTVLVLALHGLILAPAGAGLVLAVGLFGYYLSNIAIRHAGVKDSVTREWPAVRRLKQDPSLYRIHSLDQYLFPAELSSIHGISDIRNGGDNLDVAAMIHFLNMGGALTNEKEKDWASRWLGLGNVKYLLSRPNQEVTVRGFEPLHRGEDMNIHVNRNAAPRVKFFSNWKFMDGSALSDWRQSRNYLAAIYQVLGRGELDLDRDLLLHSEPPPGFPGPAPAVGPPPAVEITAHDADRLTATVDSPNHGFLFLSSNFFPGWKASVDGRPAPLLRAYLTFCAVPVEKGRHVVEFVYRSTRAYAALAFNALAVLFWIGWRWKLSGRAEPAEIPSAPKQKPGKNVPAAFAWTAFDAAPFLEKILVGWVWTNILFWLNWCAWVFEGGIQGKLAAFASGRPLASLGVPDAMGPLRGWAANLAATVLLAVLAGRWVASMRSTKS